MPSKHVYRLGAGGIVLLWTAAIFFPSLGTCHDGAIHWFDPDTAIFFGWMAGLVGLLGWYANLTLSAGLVYLLRDRHPPLWLGVVGQILALTSFTPVELAHNEAWSEPLCAWGSGFWLWFSSVTVLTGLCLYGRWFAAKDATENGAV